MNSTKKDKLFSLIKGAFSEVTYPGDDDIPGYSNIFHYMDLSTYLEVKNFVGKHWTDITPYFLTQQPASFTFFSTKAFVFYLPAYLIGITELIMSDDTDHGVIDEVFYQLSPKTTLSEERVSALNLYQKKSVLQFLLFNADYYYTNVVEAEEVDAVIKYWEDLVSRSIEFENLKERASDD